MLDRTGSLAEGAMHLLGLCGVGGRCRCGHARGDAGSQVWERPGTMLPVTVLAVFLEGCLSRQRG